METDHAPWRVERSALFAAQHLIGTRNRSFRAWQWAGRLAFRDLDFGLWWVTEELQTPNAQTPNAQTFWRQAMETRRVMRVFEARGSWPATSKCGVELRFDLRDCDILVREDNSGLARVAPGAPWLAVPASSPRRPARRPLAWKPIWGQHFRLDLARRSLQWISTELGEQKIETLPPLMREVWREGVWSRALAPIRAALVRDWRPRAVRRTSLLDFWSAIFKQKGLRVPSAFKQKGLRVPPAIHGAEGLEDAGEIFLPSRFAHRFAHHEVPASWEWQQGGASLRCPLAAFYGSKHEELEGELALRDFLRRFFTLDEVKTLLAQ